MTILPLRPTFFRSAAIRPTAVLLIGAAVFSVSLALSVPAFAQQAEDGSAAPPPMNAGASGDHGGWDHESFEHQEFREEMEQIRKEHEEIENARDALKEKCDHPAAAQVQECEDEKNALHDRVEKLHERKHILREKMDAAHKAHPDSGPQPQDSHGDALPPPKDN